MRATIRMFTGGVAALLFVATFSHAQSDLRLIKAVKNQDRAAIRSLLDQKVDVKAVQPDGATALHWASYREDLATAELLIRAGADVNAANEYGLTPLALACAARNADMVRKLLDAQANPNLASWTGVTPLMTAANAGRADIATLLLDHGANVNTAEPRRGQTPEQGPCSPLDQPGEQLDSHR